MPDRSPSFDRPTDRLLRVAMAAATAAGCSKSEPGLVPVRGKITLDGGPWPHEGSMIFTPEGGGPASRSRPAGARFSTDGAFVATSFAEGDGLFPGTYKISVECWEAEPKMANNGMVIEGRAARPRSTRVPARAD